MCSAKKIKGQKQITSYGLLNYICVQFSEQGSRKQRFKPNTNIPIMGVNQLVKTFLDNIMYLSYVHYLVLTLKRFFCGFIEPI